ncbi:DUF6777 domain-containing protein [Streptomyces sp. I05A-00742]|uniref:DUF6777 domain-containing protein n=1 Tax=Streptomyces sp. I05A-00742 TaxID=2732853 RepID=UPI0014894F33|nr:DUF6777 domain-containing protein [Streptomyces sp. I05A-00742]
MWLIPVPIDASRRRRRIRTVAFLTVPALAVGTVLTACSSDGSDGDGKKRITLEAVGQVGDGPFVPDPQSDARGVSSAGGGGATAGDAPGAFGGTRQASRCDKAQLLKDLAGDRVKAEAWAEARGIPRKTIEDHVNGLTPAVLMHDTLVTNHNYDDGTTRSYQAVLQAGVAVLVDAYGKPAVKCNCGNPLREPDASVDVRASEYNGKRWEGFAVATVTVITPRPAAKGPMKTIPLVDTEQKDKVFHREVGNDGAHDSPPVPRPPTPSRTPGTPPSTGGTPSSPAGATPSGPASSPGSSGSPSRPPSDDPFPDKPPSGKPSSGKPSSRGPSSPSGPSVPSVPAVPSRPSVPSTAGSPPGQSVRPPSAPHEPPARPSAPREPSRPAPPRTASPPAERPARPPSAERSAPRGPSEERKPDTQRREPTREDTSYPQGGTRT